MNLKYWSILGCCIVTAFVMASANCLGADSSVAAGFLTYSFPGFSPVRISPTVAGGFVVTDSAGEQLGVFGPHGNLITTIPLLGKPLAVGVDRKQRIFVGNTTLGTVDIYTMGGVYMGSLAAPVATPGDIALAEDAGLIFVTDSSAHAVKVFDLSTRGFLYQFGSQGSGPGQFDYPTGIAYDPLSGTVIVGDFMNRRLQVLDKNGVWLRTVVTTTDPPLVRPQGVDVDAAGNIYVADSLWAGVYIFDSGGNFLRVLGSYGTGDGQLRTPLDVAVMPGGVVLVADSANERMALFPKQARER